MSQESIFNNKEKKLTLSPEFMRELEFLKKECEIKKDLESISLLECLIRDQEREIK